MIMNYSKTVSKNDIVGSEWENTGKTRMNDESEKCI